MKKIITLAFVFVCLQTMIYADTPAHKPKPGTHKKTAPVPLKTKTFVNAKVNDILLVVIDMTNKIITQQDIIMGTQFTLQHKPESLKRVICVEPFGQDFMSVNKNDLDAYKVFVFNDNSLEKYHFKTIDEKTAALKKALKTENIDLYNKIQDQTLYNP